MITHQRDRGSAALEFLLIAPVFIVLALWVADAARLPTGRSEVFNAAYIAARESGRAPTPEEAREVAARSLRTNLAAGVCRSYDVAVDTSAFEPRIAPHGIDVPGHVVVEVRCTVRLRALAWAGFRESEVSATAVGTVDAFRSRE